MTVTGPIALLVVEDEFVVLELDLDDFFTDPLLLKLADFLELSCFISFFFVISSAGKEVETKGSTLRRLESCAE